jgi:putative endonuclease
MPAATDPAQSWQVYILRCLDETFYTGITTDLKRRLAEHNGGTGAKYTRSRRPVILVYSEPALSRSAAARREYWIKKLSPTAKRLLVETSANTPPCACAPPEVPVSGK